MADWLARLRDLDLPWDRFLIILLTYLLAFIFVHFAGKIARRIIRLNRFAGHKRKLSEQRQETLQGLLSGTISFLAIFIASLASLSLFVDADTIVWMVGLFSAAFGLGARPLVSDFLAGLSFIFEDSFDVGEKIQLQGLPGGIVEGVVEKVFLRTTLIQAVTGEPFVVPNGEIRVIRNFSRGRHSSADIHIKIHSHHLSEAIQLLEELNKEAPTLLPNLLEPWQIVSESGEMGQKVTLTIVAKARYAKAAEMRPRLLALVEERLSEALIEFSD